MSYIKVRKSRGPIIYWASEPATLSIHSLINTPNFSDQKFVLRLKYSLSWVDNLVLNLTFVHTTSHLAKVLDRNKSGWLAGQQIYVARSTECAFCIWRSI